MYKRLEGGGRAFLSGSRQTNSKEPLITIITSTFNVENDLPWTIESIKKQNYINIQWIIADGGSTDKTLDLLKANEDIIDYWFSESDDGIYDAWSEALRYSKGEWIQFIGAGDELADSSTLSEVVSYLLDAYPKYDLVYGYIDIISSGERQLIERVRKPWKQLKGRWCGIIPALPIHPEVFHHRTLLNRLDFNSFKLSGDVYIMLNGIRNNPPLFVDVLVDRMPFGGVSCNPIYAFKAYKELMRINNELDIRVPFLKKFLYLLKIRFKYIIFKFLGNKNFYFIADLYRKITFRNSKWLIK